jgi:hypothetical protein
MLVPDPRLWFAGRDVRRTRSDKTTLLGRSVMVDQIVQIVGSLLVLVGFAAVQVSRLNPKSKLYLTLNFLGSGTLAVEAALSRQWGFLLLEGVWALVSLTGLTAAFSHQRDLNPRAR